MLPTLTGLLLLLPAAAPQSPAAVGPGRIVLVRTSDDVLADHRRFAEGLSVSAMAGLPVCMLVDAALSPVQADLLRRLPGPELVCVGEPPQGLDDRAVRLVAEPYELFEPGADAVVTSLHRYDQLEAAADACRRKLPLLVADAGLAALVDRLGTRRLLRVASRFETVLPAGVEVRDVGSAADRLAALADEAEPYLALGNGAAARSHASGILLGAAALAAAHGGVLHLIDEEVVFDYAPLLRRSAPEGLEGIEVEGWLTGGFDLGSSEILVAVPADGMGTGIRGPVTRWGDPIVDLNRDGRLDVATETVSIGSVHSIDGRDWSISLRLIGALGSTKFRDGMRTERAVRIAPAAETIAAGLVRLYQESGVMPRSLLLAGDHREVPFDYVKDPVYADSIMHEQELASDNRYGDPDGDGYLDIAVGRFVASGRVQATALAARLASHDHWQRAAAAPSAALIYPAWADDEIELQSPMIFPSFEAMLHGVASDVGRAGYETRMHLREAGALERVLPSLAVSSLIVFAHHSGPDTWQFRIQKLAGDWQVDQLVPRGAVARGAAGTAVPFLAGAPLIVGAGCDSAGLDYEVVFENSIVHTFFEQGALGYVGNTRAGFPDTEEFLVRQLLQAALGMQPKTAGALTIGEAFRQGKNYFDLLIRERGPFRCVEPFENYGLAMRREWNSLVYYGDPALRLPVREGSPTVAAEVFTGDAPIIELQCSEPLQANKVWIMAVVAVGPLHEVTALAAPGLSYSSVPWATYADSEQPAIVGPGVFLDVPIPAAVAGTDVVLREGADWAFGGARVITDARGQRRLLLSVDLVRYAMQFPDDAERAGRVVLELR